MEHDPRLDLNDYLYFAHVVDHGGFASAGRALGIPKSRLSRHVQQLEDRLDARLLQRTSRRFAVTDAGAAFYRHAKAVMDEMQAAETAMSSLRRELTGTIRLSCSLGLAQSALSALLAGFLKKHPGVNISQLVTNELVDLVGAGVDVAIRGHVENLPDSSLIQRRLVRVEWGLFASPRYLEDHGEPAAPGRLAGHAGLALGWNAAIGEWRLESQSGEAGIVQFAPRLCSDDMATLKGAAASGLGVVSLPAYVCRCDVESGRLVRVLPGWTSGKATLSLITPSRKGAPAAVKAFTDYLCEELPKALSP